MQRAHVLLLIVSIIDIVSDSDLRGSAVKRRANPSGDVDSTSKHPLRHDGRCSFYRPIGPRDPPFGPTSSEMVQSRSPAHPAPGPPSPTLPIRSQQLLASHGDTRPGWGCFRIGVSRSLLASPRLFPSRVMSPRRHKRTPCPPQFETRALALALVFSDIADNMALSEPMFNVRPGPTPLDRSSSTSNDQRAIHPRRIHPPPLPIPAGTAFSPVIRLVLALS